MSTSRGRVLAWQAWVSKEQRDLAEPPQCAGKNSVRWNTGDEGNLYAFAICGACPLPALDECAPYIGVRGVIVAGVAYDDVGHALETCPGCWFPMKRSTEAPQGECKRRSCPTNEGLSTDLDSHRPSEYRQQITELTLAGVTRREICARLNLRERGVRHAQERWGLTGAKLAARRATITIGEAA